jgi:hypothetical protein
MGLSDGGPMRGVAAALCCRKRVLVNGDTSFHAWVGYLCPRQLGYGAASFGTMGQILIGLKVLNRFPHSA